ncbi:MAG: D-2-hydroxyacid dehydrogenase [Ruminococcus sp.]|nr:D-2-hydroxyacid dehydrogenase [Ruminococcus sp.]
MKISVLDRSTISPNGDISFSELEKLGDVRIFPMTSPDDTVKNISDAEIVLCNKVLITRDIIDKCPNIKYIGLFATGFNNVDIEYAAQKGITVCNAGSYSTDAVAQQVFACILDRYSRIRDYDTAVRNGEWIKSPTFSYFPFPTAELSGRTLSIVGYGSIGHKVAWIGRAFGMNIIISTRTVPESCPYELADIFRAAEKADILTFHCPLTEQTRGIVNSELLNRMKPSAMLINTSRGGVVNENDLADALNNNKISAAYLDVLDKEPMSPDTSLRYAKNCIITPHTAWAAYETRKRLAEIVFENVRAWLDGSPQNKVN